MTASSAAEAPAAVSSVMWVARIQLARSRELVRRRYSASVSFMKASASATVGVPVGILSGHIEKVGLHAFAASAATKATASKTWRTAVIRDIGGGACATFWPRLAGPCLG